MLSKIGMILSIIGAVLGGAGGVVTSINDYKKQKGETK